MSTEGRVSPLQAASARLDCCPRCPWPDPPPTSPCHWLTTTSSTWFGPPPGNRHCASDSHPLELAGITLSVTLCAEIGLEASYLTGSANGGQDGILEANTCTWEVGVLVSTARTSRWMLTSLGRLASATAAPVLASPV